MKQADVHNRHEMDRQREDRNRKLHPYDQRMKERFIAEMLQERPPCSVKPIPDEPLLTAVSDDPMAKWIDHAIMKCGGKMPTIDEQIKANEKAMDEQFGNPVRLINVLPPLAHLLVPVR